MYAVDRFVGIQPASCSMADGAVHSPLVQIMKTTRTHKNGSSRPLFARSGVLFARPSFAEGFSRIFDLGATLNNYNFSQSETEADLKSLASDWSAVGDYLGSALSELASAER
jgi:hypothetical protein